LFSSSLQDKTSEIARRLKKHDKGVFREKSHLERKLSSFIIEKYAKDVKTVTEGITVYFVYFSNN